jgi:hypothetical protein
MNFVIAKSARLSSAKPLNREVKIDGVTPNSMGHAIATAFSGPLVVMSIDRHRIGSSKAFRAVTVHCASSGLKAKGTEST